MRRALALAVARAVVRVVEAFALEVDRGCVQDPIDGHSSLGIDLQGLFAEGLLQLEGSAIRASVLIDRHGGDYKLCRLRLSAVVESR